MPPTKPFCIYISFLFASLYAPNLCFGQLKLEPEKWAIELTKHKLKEPNSLGSLTKQLIAADSSHAFSFLDSLEASEYAKGYDFRMFFCMVKADFLFAKFAGYDKYKDRRSKELEPIKQQLIKLYVDALDAAYHTEDDLSIGWVCFYSAKRMKHFGETGWAVMYSKYGVDLFEKVNYEVEPPVYTDLAELLYQVREYDQSMIYAKKGLLAWKKNDIEKINKDSYKYKTRALNTIGNTFYQKNQLDSAHFYYQQALLIAKQNKDTLLTGTALGNIGRIMYAQNNFDSAYSLFKTDYQNNKDDSLYNNAANAAEWAARANLARGNTVAALSEAREAIRLLGLWPSGPYLRNTYYTFKQVFRAMGQYDSAFFYSDKYAALNDSLEKEIATSSLAISKARLDNEQSRYEIQNLHRDKQSQIVYRNIIIGTIIVLAIIALLLLNRRRLQEKIKSQKAEQEKLRMAQEVIVAKEQMRLFTESIVEKTALIEKLEGQAVAKEFSSGQHALIAELSQQTILTEEDWDKFKTLFETLHPNFFIKLKQQFSNITVAEQRMAALIRLMLTTRQMASMLGISVDSVHKTRQRLRQRLQIATDSSIEETVAAI